MCIWCVEDERGRDENDSDIDYSVYPYSNHIDTQRIEEIPAKEPKPNAVPLKSALKKKSNQQGGGGITTSSSPATPVQETTNNVNGIISMGIGGGIGNNNSGGAPCLTPTSVNSSGIIMPGGSSGGTSVNQRPLVVRQDATNSYNLK